MDCEASCSMRDPPKGDDPGFQIAKLNGYAFIVAILLFVFGTGLVLGIVYLKRRRYSSEGKYENSG